MKAISFSRGTMGVVMWVLMVAAAFGEAEIQNVSASQRWPWNGKVDIHFEVVGELPADAGLVVTATDCIHDKSYVAESSAISGDTGRDQGNHDVVWDMDMQGMTLLSSNVVLNVAYIYSRYCIVDLEGGTNAVSYPVMWMDDAPSNGFNVSEYKTTKLVLRRIDSGTFSMGARNGELGSSTNEILHEVTLTKPFYIGVFEVTQKQWDLVMGNSPSEHVGDMRPVEHVSYDMIRGNGSGTNWPISRVVDESSFIGKLRAKTGLEFDLPTEAQWEYACRAGTRTALNSGQELSNDESCPEMGVLGRYYRNSWRHVMTADGYWYVEYLYHEVAGSYLPNAWGLYDMHGNVFEWCLDRYTWNLGRDAVSDPMGPMSGNGRVIRGGSHGSVARGCRSAARSNSSSNRQDAYVGFRLVCSGGL